MPSRSWQPTFFFTRSLFRAQFLNVDFYAQITHSSSEKPREHMAVSVYTVDPLTDPRWNEFCDQHPRASVFHTRGWLKALHITYGYEPVVVTTSDPKSDITNGIVFCEVKSWATGRRMVSLPFSDHCEPLIDRVEERDFLLSYVEERVARENQRYIEIRPLSVPVGEEGRFRPCEFYYLHRLSLLPQLDPIYRSFHKDCVQRKIQRAEREKLTYEEGTGEELLRGFYDLFVITRQRHRLPPPPLTWFRSLMNSMGDKLKIRLARKEGQPVASIVTITHKDSVVYKYGCSDATFNNLGGMQGLFWRTIQEGKELGLSELDLGRSSLDNQGLVTFKDRWGAKRSTLTYYRYPASLHENELGGWKLQVITQLSAHLPKAVMMCLGRLLYKHIG
jgi:Acetyltransferase (GNAT) domain